MSLDYDIRDVDKKWLIFLKNQNWTLRQSGKDVRFRITTNSADEVLSKNTYPAIGINSGFPIVDEEVEWNQNRGDIYVKKAETGPDSQKVVTLPQKTDLTYQYTVSYFVLFNSHNNFMLKEFFRIFPRTFVIPLVINGQTEHIEYRRIGNTDLTERIDDKKIYRRDFVLQTHLRLDLQKTKEALRPFAGVDITVTPEKDLDAFEESFSGGT